MVVGLWFTNALNVITFVMKTYVKKITGLLPERVCISFVNALF